MSAVVIEGARIWERRAVPAGDGSLALPLRFRVVPATWPDIALVAPDGTRADVTADAYEIRIRCDTGDQGVVAIDVAGWTLSFERRVLSSGPVVERIEGSGPVELIVRADADSATVEVDGTVLPLAARDPETMISASPVTANVSGFRLRARPPAAGRIVSGAGAEVIDAVVYGLRPLETPLYRRARAAAGGAGRTLYEGESFVVSDACVADAVGAPAWVTDRTTIVSPVRVIEEFAWRDTPYGDMTRVADRNELWRSAVEPGRFPELRSGFRSLDAAFALATETFQRNSSGEFSLPGETDLWSAGYFQGSGLGFGSWRRDTSHVALRTGNLIDPKVARASLVHVVTGGFDNGSDGDALPAVAVWDHVLATGDESLAQETWSALTGAAAALDARFEEERGLVRAPQSTSNDLFEEPEAGGFALSTEIYAMATYAALAEMATLGTVDDPRSGQWKHRAATMRRAIVGQYWNDAAGYFTSGPVGSASHTRACWETSGAEAAVWGFLGADGEPFTRSVLDGARRTAMSDFGLVLFPDRDDDNHFCHSVWYGWQAGFARAAARVGDADLVRQLIGQQVRTAVLNKTFYEVTDARSGESWRWPGQLWHAAGFASLVLFGLFGIDYDRRGLTFAPAVAPELEGARIDGLRYRGAVLDIEVRGQGTRCEAILDGHRVERVGPETTGRHTVVLELKS